MLPSFIRQAREARAQGTVFITAGPLTSEFFYQHLRAYSKKGAPTANVPRYFLEDLQALYAQLRIKAVDMRLQFTAWGHSIANEVELKKPTFRSPHHLARILFNAANNIPLSDFLPIQLVYRYESSAHYPTRDEVYYGGLAMLEKGVINYMESLNVPVGAVEVTAKFVSYGRRTFKKADGKRFTLTDLEAANLFILRGDNDEDSIPGFEEVPYIQGHYMAAADFSRMPELLTSA